MIRFKIHSAFFLTAILASMPLYNANAGEHLKCAGKPVVEIVIFSSIDGVSDKEIQRTALNVTLILRKMVGFKDRSFSKSANGRWVDVVQWQSFDSANAAAQEIMKSGAAAPFFALINEKDISIKYLCE